MKFDLAVTQDRRIYHYTRTLHQNNKNISVANAKPEVSMQRTQPVVIPPSRYLAVYPIQKDARYMTHSSKSRLPKTINISVNAARARENNIP